MSSPTGGPAFPQPLVCSDNGAVQSSADYCEGGMTLRDYHASNAMAAILTNHQFLMNLGTVDPNEWADRVAAWSYRFADALIARSGQ